jgi:hypothetical protein
VPDTRLREVNLDLEEIVKAGMSFSEKTTQLVTPNALPYTGAWISRPETGMIAGYTFVNSIAINPDLWEVNAVAIGWSENNDSFTQANLIDIEDDKAQDLIYRIKEAAIKRRWANVANRIVTLFHDAKEEEPDISGIPVASLRSFYNFMQLYADLTCPVISLTPDNNLYASWRENQNRVFSIHFLTSEDVRFVILTPNDKHPDKQIRLSGTVTPDILMEKVSPFKILDWISE